EGALAVGRSQRQEKPILLARLDHYLLPEIGRRGCGQRDKGISPVVPDDEVGWHPVNRLAGEDNTRIGPQTHAEQRCSDTVVAQGQPAGPVALSKGEVRNRLLK